jgi:hypothetical protein
MIRSTKSVLRFVLLLAVALLAIPASARAQAEDPAAAQPAEQEPAPRNGEFAFGGPIELQDVFLPAQMRPQSYPESAEVLPPGAFSVRTVVDWTNHLAQTDRYLFDGESVSTVLKLRYAPWQRVEVGALKRGPLSLLRFSWRRHRSFSDCSGVIAASIWSMTSHENPASVSVAMRVISPRAPRSAPRSVAT